MTSKENNLPPNWSLVILGEISYKIHYGYTASAINDDTGPKLLRITDIQYGKVIWNDVPFCRIEQQEINKYLLRENDIVFARTGATVGKSFLIKGKIPESVFASYLIRLQLSDKALSEYIYYFFQSNDYWKQIKSSSAGIGQPNVNAQKLSNIKIPLPRLPVQHQIVSKLEELFSELDNAVDNLKKTKAQIKIYRQAVLKYAFEGRLNHDSPDFGINMIKKSGESFNQENQGSDNGIQNLPEGWKWVKLETIGEVVRGASPRPAGSPKYFGGKIPWITVREITKDKCKYLSSVSSYVTEEGKKKSRFIEMGTLMLTNSGATLGVPKIISIGGCFNDGSVAILNLDEPTKSYLYWFLYSKTDQLRKINQGAAQPNLNTSIVKDIDVPYCDCEIQKTIVEEIESRFSVADKLEQTIDESLKKAEALRQSILKQAFEGRLV